MTVLLTLYKTGTAANVFPRVERFLGCVAHRKILADWWDLLNNGDAKTPNGEFRLFRGFSAAGRRTETARTRVFGPSEPSWVD